MAFVDYDDVMVTIPESTSGTGITVPPATGGDDSALIQNTLFEGAGKKVTLPAGDYFVSRTIYVPENTLFEGEGKITLMSESIINLDSIMLRNVDEKIEYIQPILTNERPKVGLKKNIRIEGITVHGGDDTAPTRTAGVLFADAENCTTDKVNVFNVNWDEDFQDVTNRGFNLISVRSRNIKFIGGYLDRGGYECLGVYDQCKDVLVQHVNIGTGKRCSAQIHRGTDGVIFQNNILRQNYYGVESHGCFLIHGSEGYPCKNISFSNNIARCDSTSSIVSTIEYAESVAFKDNILVGENVVGMRMAGENFDFTISGNRISVKNGYGIHIVKLRGFSAINDNNIKSNTRGIFVADAGYMSISENKVDAPEFGIGIQSTGGRDVIMNENIIKSALPFSSDFHTRPEFHMRDNVEIITSI